MTNTTTDRWKTIYPALALGITTAAFIIAKTGRDALFFQGKGIFQLPVATMTIAAASLPLAILFVKMMRSFGARPARVGVMLFAAVVLSLDAPFLQPGDSPLLFNVFIFIPAIFAIIFASLWLLASDIFETTPKSESARAFGKIGASSLAGGMAGGFIAKGLLPLMEPRWLIFCGALLVLVVIGLVIRAHRTFPTNIAPKTAQSESRPGYFAPLSNP